MSKFDDVLHLLESKPENMSVREWCAQQNPPISYQYLMKEFSLRRKLAVEQAPVRKPGRPRKTSASITVPETEVVEPSIQHLKSSPIRPPAIPIEDNDDPAAEKDDVNNDTYLKDMNRAQRNFNLRINAIVKDLAAVSEIQRIPFDFSKYDPKRNIVPPEFQDGSPFSMYLERVGAGLGQVTDLINSLEIDLLRPTQAAPVASNLPGMNNNGDRGVTVNLLQNQNPKREMPHPISSLKQRIVRGAQELIGQPEQVLQSARVDSVIDNLKQLHPNFNRLRDFHTAACMRVKLFGKEGADECEADHVQMQNYMSKFLTMLEAGVNAATNQNFRQMWDAYTQYSKTRAAANAFYSAQQQNVQRYVPYIGDENFRS